MCSLQSDLSWDANDHAGLVPYMVECLRNDGHPQLAAFISQPRPDGTALTDGLKDGAREADNPVSPYWINVVAHFHDPCTHRGLEPLSYSAADAAVGARRAAVAAWKNGDLGKACTHVGRCLHLIGDVGGIPHHAAGIGYLVEDPYGHRDYENWLRDNANWKRYTVTFGGYYAPWRSFHTCSSIVHMTASERTFDWIDQLAVAPRRLLPAVDKHHQGFQERFPYTASILVPSTIRWGAGFIHAFLRDPEVVAAWPNP